MPTEEIKTGQTRGLRLLQYTVINPCPVPDPIKLLDWKGCPRGQWPGPVTRSQAKMVTTALSFPKGAYAHCAQGTVHWGRKKPHSLRSAGHSIWIKWYSKTGHIILLSLSEWGRWCQGSIDLGHGLAYRRSTESTDPPSGHFLGP